MGRLLLRNGYFWNSRFLVCSYCLCAAKWEQTNKTGVSSIWKWIATPPLLPRNPQKPVGTVVASGNGTTRHTLEIRKVMRTQRGNKHKNGNPHKCFRCNTHVGLLITTKNRWNSLIARVKNGLHEVDPSVLSLFNLHVQQHGRDIQRNHFFQT